MPGPNSAPNGDRRLVYGWDREWDSENEVWKPIPTREKLRRKNRLVSGKTAAKRKK